jgi:hypothetical protein
MTPERTVAIAFIVLAALSAIGVAMQAVILLLMMR